MQSFFFFTYIICSEIHTQVMIQRKEWTQVFSESIDGELCQMLQSKLAHATSMQAYTANPELTCTEYMWGREVGKTNYGSSFQLLKCTVHENSLADHGVQFV